MDDTARKELDLLDVLMRDHRGVEALFRDFEQLQRTGKETGTVIAAACAELKMHDTLETEVLYSALADAAPNPALQSLLEKSEDEHDVILELMDNLERTRRDTKDANSRFAVLAERMKQHILAEEAKLFPLVKALKLDFDAMAAAIKVRRPELGQKAA